VGSNPTPSANAQKLMTAKQSAKFDEIVRESGKSASRLMREAIEAMWPEIYKD
jgi:hypothetical protein